MSTEASIEPGETWRERAGRIVLDPLDAHGVPVATPTDRRWLWRLENTLAVTATSDTQRQLAADLYAYLAETCEHHLRHYEGDEEIPPHTRCLWCSEVKFEGDAANEVARAIFGMREARGV
jgi:hypothetical protein